MHTVCPKCTSHGRYNAPRLHIYHSWGQITAGDAVNIGIAMNIVVGSIVESLGPGYELRCNNCCINEQTTIFYS